MEQQRLYKDLAKYYDLIYSFKDYKQEAKDLKSLVKEHKRSKGNQLLEVACGSGKHAQHLTSSFDVLGVDLHPGMLRIARKSVKGAKFCQADMTKLSLGKTFDVILCLFSSIGYVKTYANLKKTIKGFSKHLKPGGVVLIEPWLTKSVYKVGTPHMTTYQDSGIRIARLSTSMIRGDVSVMDMHYLIAEKGKAVKHFVDRHELGLFSKRQMLKIMKDEGLKAIHQTDAAMEDRGIYIGVKED